MTVTQAAPLPLESTEVKARAHLQPADTSPYGVPTAVAPDVAYTTDQGGRVEVYTSAGDNDGTPDWRSVNAFAYLINEVPANKNLYATVFNSLYDSGTSRELATGKFELRGADGKVLPAEKTFRPSAAFLKQINQYPNKAKAQEFIHVLGARRSMGEAYNAPSTLARLLSKSAGAGVMVYCSDKGSTGTSTGACLTTNVDEALMHSKYALFEQTRDATGKLWNDVIWVTSANLNGSSGGKKSNTSIAIYGDKAGYEKLRDDVFQAEVDQKFTTGFKAAQTSGITGANSDFKFYPSPRVKDFEALAIKAAADVPGKTNCKAYLAHSLFNSSRKDILEQLERLESSQCSVKILLGENAISDIVDSYFTMSNTSRELINRVEFGNVHDKAITVSYTAGGVDRGFTFGGSANANGTSLTHDELAFKAEDLTVTRAVEQQLERLYQLIRGGKANVQVSGLAINPATATVLVSGNPLTLRAKISPSTASVKTVTWESSDPGVAKVDATTGKVTAVSPGTATITATSLSGNRTATSTVTVPNDSGTQTSQPPAEPNVINVPPTLSMDKYQTLVGSGTEDKRTEVVVSWGTGTVDIQGSVALQYYDAGSWKTKTTIYTNAQGLARKPILLKSSRAWRLKATKITSPAGATLGNDAKVSAGYAYNIVKTRANTATPRIYAPTMVKSGQAAPFLVTGTRLSGKLRLQYLAGSGWKTKVTFTIGGGTQKFVSTPVGSTRKWRVATSTSRSSSVTVKVTG